MTDKHTPGPWKVGNRYTMSGVYTENETLVANTHSSQRTYKREEQIAEQNANARLIARSPDMLEAIKEFCCRVEVGEIRSKKTYAKFTAIIDKVESEDT